MLSCDGSDVRAAGIGAPDLGSASIGELLDVDISGIATGQQLSWNGTALVPVTEPFDLGLHLPDLSTAGALLAEIVLARPVDFPAAFAGSTGAKVHLRTRLDPQPFQSRSPPHPPLRLQTEPLRRPGRVASAGGLTGC